MLDSGGRAWYSAHMVIEFPKRHPRTTGTGVLVITQIIPTAPRERVESARRMLAAIALLCIEAEASESTGDGA